MKLILKWSLLLTALMPVWYSSSVLFPFIFPKALYFRGLVLIACVVFCILCAIQAEFRNEMIRKFSALWKNSVFKWMAFFNGALLLSTIFAFDRYMAMFGNIEREEGFVGLFFFYIFFLLVAMVFKKRDWYNFFAVTLFTSGILFLVEINQYLFQGNGRPGSLTDNPIFLSAYFIFSLVAGIILYQAGRRKNNVTVMTLVMCSLITTFIGIILAQTRGVLLGMFVGLIAVIAYRGFVGENTMITKKISLRKALVGVLIVMAVFVGIFVTTRTSPLWSHVPGLSRIAQISSNDPTTRARLLNAGIALHAIHPTEAGITRTLFGWGWDNYIYAWQQFYNPAIYNFDPALFDRAHDKLIDVILMTGVVGFLSYLMLWGTFFRAAIKKGKKFSWMMALFIFWGIAYFLQNLTVFDTLVTFITFYAMFAYLLYETTETTAIATA